MEEQSKCIFCEILAGNLPVSMIYEDDKVAVFPPLEPVNPGHILIIPKKHAPYLKDLDEQTAMYIMKIAKKMTATVRKSKFKCEAVNIFIADGQAADQEVFHFHLHVIPRYKEDGFGLKYGKNNFIKMSREEIDAVAEEIKKHLVEQ